jgi:hypothetical protein
MQAYGKPGGGSGVIAYEIGEDSIVLVFRDGEGYLYDAEHPGRQHVHRMQARARRHAGLATYVNQHVRDNYARKLTRAELRRLHAPAAREK